MVSGGRAIIYTPSYQRNGIVILLDPPIDNMMNYEGGSMKVVKSYIEAARGRGYSLDIQECCEKENGWSRMPPNKRFRGTIHF